MLAVTLAAAIGVGVVAGDDRARASRRRSPAGPSPWMPAVATGPALSTTWFCPGVPATGAAGTAGEVVISNSTDGRPHRPGHAARRRRRSPSSRRWRSRGSGGRSSTRRPPSSRRTSAPSSRSTAPACSSSSARRRRPARRSRRAPPRTSTNWYLAEGFTAEDSTEQLVLTNPFDQTVIVDVGFATDEGSREPPQLQGFPVAAALGAGDRHGLDRRPRRAAGRRAGQRPARGVAARRAGAAVRRRRPPRVQHDAGVARCCARSGGSPTA